MDNKPTFRKGTKRAVILLISLLLVLCVAAGLTLGYVFDSTGEVTNEFNPGKVTTTIVEEFDGETKKSVKVKNTGDTDAYIRVKLNFTWVSEDDENIVYSQTPKLNTDYTVTYVNNAETDNDPKWVLGVDGFWYYTMPVAPDDSTKVLIEECKVIDTAIPEGYKLSLNVISSAIQADPTDAVQSAWGATVDNTTKVLTPKSSEVTE